MKTISKEPKAKRPNEDTISSLARRVMISAGFGFALLAVLLSAAALLSLRLDIPTARLGLLAIPLAGIAAFVTGYLNVRPVRRQGLMFGILGAAALYVLVLLAATALSRGSPGLSAVILLVVMLLAGAAGGVAAANKSAVAQQNKKKRKRYSR